MSTKIGPCYGCETREIGCHANCDAYNEWASETREKNRRIKEEKEMDIALKERRIYAAIRRVRKRSKDSR